MQCKSYYCIVTSLYQFVARVLHYTASRMVGLAGSFGWTDACFYPISGVGFHIACCLVACHYYFSLQTCFGYEYTLSAAYPKMRPRQQIRFQEVDRCCCRIGYSFFHSVSPSIWKTTYRCMHLVKLELGNVCSHPRNL